MKILVIDDALDMRMITHKILRKLGHEVTLANDADSAWALMQEYQFSIIICDWMMPGMSGTDLCKKIRKQSFEHYIYFILLTGKSDKQSLIEGLDAGADDFIGKPFLPEELKAKLHSAGRVIDLEAKLKKKTADQATAHQIIQNDLKKAAVTQYGLLPEKIADQHIESSWFYQPATFIGGDTFNYFMPSDDLLVFFCIDISGHGISSAMLSSSLNSTLSLRRGLYGGRITAERAGEIPSLFAHNLNEMLLNTDNNEHYLTMFFGIIHFPSNDLHYVQAGHPFPLHYDASNDELNLIEVNGYPVGLFPGAEYETSHLKLGKHDKLVLYSDGINEVDEATTGEPFSSEMIEKRLHPIINESPDDIIKTISTEWLTEEQLNAPPDDLSILVFEYKKD